MALSRSSIATQASQPTIEVGGAINTAWVKDWIASGKGLDEAKF